MKGPESALACGQCHSVWAFTGMESKIEFNRQGTSFRPGKSDLGQRFVVQPNEKDHPTQKEFIHQTEPDFFRNRFWGDGMIRVTGREFNGVQDRPVSREGISPVFPATRCIRKLQLRLRLDLGRTISWRRRWRVTRRVSSAIRT